MNSAPHQGVCLLLTVQQQASGQAGWHARVLGADGGVLDFDSPFELVRFLSRAPPLPGALPLTPQPGKPGLR